jgi:hypothetical protein
MQTLLGNQRRTWALCSSFINTCRISIVHSGGKIRNTPALLRDRLDRNEISIYRTLDASESEPPFRGVYLPPDLLAHELPVTDANDVGLRGARFNVARHIALGHDSVRRDVATGCCPDLEHPGCFGSGIQPRCRDLRKRSAGDDQQCHYRSRYSLHHGRVHANQVISSVFCADCRHREWNQ